MWEASMVVMIDSANIKHAKVLFMIRLFGNLKKWSKYLFAITIFLSILHGCTPHKKSLNKEQREKINAFFLELLVDHQGAYTLFGSKPMTIESLLSPQEYDESHQYVESHPEELSFSIDRRLEEGWEEWKKVSSHFPSPHYILVEIPSKDRKDLVLVNAQKTIKTLRKYYEDFRQIVDMDFDPQKVVYELREGKYEFWVPILNNYVSLGILLGYGNRNSHLFEKYLATESLDSFEASDKMDPRSFGGSPDLLSDPRFRAAECYLNGKPLYIPIFVKIDPVESKILVNQYKKEREQISERYRGKDFLNTTLSEWSKK